MTEPLQDSRSESRWKGLWNGPFGERVSVWDFSGLKDIFQVIDSFVILSKSVEREEAAACLSEGCHCKRVESSAKEIDRIFQGGSENIDED